MKVKIFGTEPQLKTFFEQLRYFQNQDGQMCRAPLTSTWPEQLYVGELNPKIEDCYVIVKTLAHFSGVKIEPIS